MTIDGKKLYTDIQSALADLSEQLREAGVTKGIGLSAFAGAHYGQPQGLIFKLEIGDYGAETKVEGKDLQAMVEEIVRREKFDRAQSQLKIGAQVIDGVVK